jgi:hypothetical protein
MKKNYLKNVALCCIDTLNQDLAIRSLEKCSELMGFKSIILFTEIDCNVCNDNIQIFKNPRS